MREGTTHADRRRQISEQLERLSRDAERDRRHGVRGRDDRRLVADRARRRRARSDGRRAAQSDVPEPRSSRATRRRRRAQLLQQRAQPGFLAAERFSIVVAGDHPDGRVVADPRDARQDDARTISSAFHRARYVPDHAVIAIAGDISMADAMKKIKARLGGWKKAGTPAPPVTDPAALQKPGIFLVERPNSVQTNLAGRHAGDPAHRSRLLRADGAEQGDRRRADRTAVPPSARGEGLHLRRRIRASTRRGSAGRGRRTPKCAPR